MKPLGWLRRAARLERLGPGLIAGAADDDPSGIATYSQAGAQFGVNMLWTIVVPLPADVHDADDQRQDRTRHGTWAGRQYAPDLSALGCDRFGVAAVHRQHHQHWRRSRRHGRGGKPRPRLWRAFLHHLLRTCFAHSASVGPLSSLRPFPEVADLGPVRLCRCRPHGADRLGRGRVENSDPATFPDGSDGDYGGGGLRNDHQSLPAVLAGVGGGGG